MRRLLLSAFGIGFLPAMPGTWASLATAAAVFCAQRATGSLLVAPLVAVVLGSLATLALGNAPRGGAPEPEDPSWVVTDEVAGQGLALLVAAWALGDSSLAAGVGGFVAFRIFDVWKPRPVRDAERLPGGLGILADDLLAGLMAGLVVWGVAAAVSRFA